MRLWLALVWLCLAPSAHAGRVLAVLQFDVDSANADYEPLGRGIANMLITDLERTGSVRVVERERIQSVLTELSLQQSAYVDPATAQRLGRGVGASDVVVGGITTSGGQMRIDARLVSVETGEVVVSAQAEGREDDFFKIEEKLVRELTRALKVDLSGRNEKQFVQRSVGSTSGAVLYGRAVAAYDAGDVSEADRAVQLAASDAGSSKLAKAFEADIKPIPPLYAMLGFALGVRAGTFPNDFLSGVGSIDLAAGYSPSEQFALFGRITTTGAASAHAIVPMHQTRALVDSVRLFPIEAGARVRLRQLFGHGVYGVGSAGIAPGWQSFSIEESRVLERKGFVALSASGGLDMVFLQHERVGGFFGLYATLAAFHLGDHPGLLARGPRLQPGIEARFGYITLGGER